MTLYGQEIPDSTNTSSEDTNPVETKKKKEKKEKKPMTLMTKGMLWSFIPGAGQVYLSKFSNRPKWIGRNPWVWKLPIIYGGLGAATYFIITNQKEQKFYKETYLTRDAAGDVNNPEVGEGAKTLNLDGDALITLQSQHQNWRDLSIFIFIGVYLLNIVDAGVQAHFARFDVTPNLSLSIEPVMPSINSFGAGLKLNFK